MLLTRRKQMAAIAAGLVAVLGVLPARGQAPGTACTSPLDPACNHLKCYPNTAHNHSSSLRSGDSGRHQSETGFHDLGTVGAPNDEIWKPQNYFLRCQ